MSHAALVNGTLFWLVVLLTLLLVLFVYAVVVARPEDDVPAGASAPGSLTVESVVRTPPAPAPALPVRRPKAPVPPAGDAGQPGGTGYTARHTPAAAPVISPPKVPTGPPRRLVGAWMLVFAGLAIAVAGGWLLLGTGRGVTACSHQAAAICSGGFVVLTAIQVFGGAIILAGLAVFFTALYRALR
jgi:hypothetical protein